MGFCLCQCVFVCMCKPVSVFLSVRPCQTILKWTTKLVSEGATRRGSKDNNNNNNDNPGNGGVVGEALSFSCLFQCLGLQTGGGWSSPVLWLSALAHGEVVWTLPWPIDIWLRWETLWTKRMDRPMASSYRGTIPGGFWLPGANGRSRRSSRQVYGLHARKGCGETACRIRITVSLVSYHSPLASWIAQIVAFQRVCPTDQVTVATAVRNGNRQFIYVVSKQAGLSHCNNS